jgi:CMP-N-acetylneuraminic acid synthetase
MGKRQEHQDFSGSPIVDWPTTASLETELFYDVFVSTDNKKFADIAQKLGAKVPWRPKNLADNSSETTTVIQKRSWHHAQAPKSRPLGLQDLPNFVLHA